MDLIVAHGADLLFFLFALLAVAGAVGVVLLRNPMYGALGLLLTFLSVAVLFLLRHAEFVGVVQIFVYGGGIMVLFLFVIMLINLHRLQEARLFWSQSPAALVLAVAIAALFAWVLLGQAFGPAFVRPEVFTHVEGVNAGNTQAVAMSLYRDYLVPFEIASIFLLVAMIGAVVLGRRQ
jgi:NADH-quinone oxidoreductase subunit J